MSTFIYTTYIATSPKKLWRALTEPAKTKKWWTVSFKSDWRVGSSYAIKMRGVTIDDPDQVVLESEPHTRLSYTWHTFSPEWAKAHAFSDEFVTKLNGEPRSKVTFDITDLGDVVKLTMTHADLKANGTVLASVRDGWPRLLSSLKSLLETGEPLSLD
jgi:uncharacterized protein YndB with AHSA1/START domain